MHTCYPALRSLLLRSLLADAATCTLSLPRRGAAKAQAAARAAAAKSLQQVGSGLSEGGPGMADRVVAEAAAEGMEGREEAGSEKGPAATGGGGGGATSRTTSAQDMGGASGAAGGVEKEAAAQGKEEEEEEEELPGWGGSGTKEYRRARRRALEQVGQLRNAALRCDMLRCAVLCTTSCPALCCAAGCALQCHGGQAYHRLAMHQPSTPLLPLCLTARRWVATVRSVSA